MIRHAESPYIFGKERTRGLSPEGEEKARKEILASEKIDVVVSSPFQRAIKSVEPIAKTRKLEIELHEELRERMIKGNYQLPWNQVKTAIEKSYSNKDYCLPGGETTRQAATRAIPVIKNLLKKYSGKNIVVGTHGNIMTIMMNYFDERYGYKFWENASMPDIYKLKFIEGELVEVNRLWKL